MFDSRYISDIVNRLLDSIPPGVRNLPKDLEKNFKIILQQSFNKMNLVTREEFDVQVKVLERTRVKLEALEQKLNEFENPQR